MFISKFSNQKNPHCVSLYRLAASEDDVAHRTKEFWATILDSAGKYCGCPLQFCLKDSQTKDS